jgi:O-6-methylguanine DNA methyltransferase
MKDFSIKVLNIVSKIPSGKLMTYSSVAQKAGSSRAYRAVGNILNRNYRERQWQLPVVKGEPVPCHRVIRSDGSIGGYALGSTKKEKLLEKEGHVIDKHKIKLMNLV